MAISADPCKPIENNLSSSSSDTIAAVSVAQPYRSGASAKASGPALPIGKVCPLVATKGAEKGNQIIILDAEESKHI
jgi:hypothetical protein